MTIYLTPPSGGGAASVPSATTTVEGKVRLATTVEAQDVNNETLAVTPKALNAQINSAIVGGIDYKGSIDAANIPTALVNANQGDFYKISVANANVAGTNWDIGDNLIVNTDMGGTFDAAKIDKIDSTDTDLATVAVTGSYADLSNTPTLATVATSGSYNDLTNQPNIPTNSTDLGDTGDLVRTTDVASATAQGIVELATNAETAQGTDSTKAVTPVGLANELAGHVQYIGDFSAGGGTPSLANTKKGDLYRISVGGTRFGRTWVAGDHLLVNEDMGGMASSSKINKISVASLLDELGDVTITSAAVKQTLRHDGSGFVNAQLAYSDLTGTPTLGTAAALDHGIGANQIVKLDGNAKLPAVDGSALINLPSGSSFSTRIESGATVTAVANEFLFLTNNSSSGIDVTLPANPSEGDFVALSKQSSTNSSANEDPTGGTSVVEIFEGATKLRTIDLPSGQGTVFIVYDSTTSAWTFPTTGLNVVEDSNVFVTPFATAFGNKAYILTRNGNVEFYCPQASQVIEGRKQRIYKAYAGTLTILSYNGSATEIYDPLTNSNVASLVVAGHGCFVDILRNASGQFIVSAPLQGALLKDISNVNITNIQANQTLSWDGTNSQWINSTPSSGGLASVSADPAPALGGDLDVAGHAITSSSNGNVAINPDGTGDISIGADLIPDTNNTHTIGDEDNRYISYYGDMNGAIRFKAKNDQGAGLTKGQVVYISGVSGTVPTVKLAQANSASTMPAFGLVQANANAGADVEIITFGNLTDYDTTTLSLSLNDTVYVSATTAGALTNTPPAGEANLIQNMGRVIRANTAGIIKVGGAGRSNATPNLNNGNIFLGNSSNQAVSTTLSTVAADTTLSNLGSLVTSRNNLGLGTAAVLDTGTGANQVVKLDGNAKLPAVDGSALTNVGKLIDYGTVSSNSNIFKNRGYFLNANNLTLTLGNQSLFSDGDVIGITSVQKYTVTISLSATDIGNGATNLVYVGSGATGTTSHTFVVDKEEIIIRNNGNTFYIVSATKLAELSEDTSPVLGGDLDVSTFDIVSSSNNNIELAANGTGVVKVKPNTTGGHLELDGDGTNAGKLRLMCQLNSHGIYLQSPPHSANANYTLTFPTALGNANDVLKTDANGNLSWVAQSGGGGGGSAPVVSEQNSTATLSAPASSGILEQIYTISSSSAVTLTLPSATSTNMGEGFKYQFKRLGAGAVTIQCATNEFIDHSGQTNFSIGAQYDSITLVANNTSPNPSWLLI